MKLRTLFIAALTLLAILPTLALAQNPNPHGFYGKASVDGAVVTSGIRIAALIDGVEAVSTFTTSGGEYVFIVQEDRPGQFSGKAIHFKIGELAAVQTAVFTPFNNDALNLTATSVVTPAPPPPPS